MYIPNRSLALPSQAPPESCVLRHRMYMPYRCRCPRFPTQEALRCSHRRNNGMLLLWCQFPIQARQLCGNCQTHMTYIFQCVRHRCKHKYLSAVHNRYNCIACPHVRSLRFHSDQIRNMPHSRRRQTHSALFRLCGNQQIRNMYNYKHRGGLSPIRLCLYRHICTTWRYCRS